ncbi:rhomboid family intramembrane serine protease [Rothia sp. ZJ932]|nr:rhomboid family intramembrane serine protease [Rothia sp. ZJ932]
MEIRTRVNQQDPYSPDDGARDFQAPQPTRYGAYEEHQQFPTCARHPDQVSYVRCGRCARPTCGQCQIPLEVGMICTDCYRQATGKNYHQEQRKARGGVWANYPVTMVLIVLNLLIYAAQVILPGATVLQHLAFNGQYVQYTDEWWRMLTAGFVHSQSNIAHVGMNMFTLYLFGQALEPLMGRVKYLLTYLLAILGGSLAVLMIAPTATVVGASGGVFGLFGALLVLTKLRGGNTRSLATLIAINFAFGLIFPNISWEGHLGGLIAGALVAYLLQLINKKPAVHR